MFIQRTRECAYGIVASLLCSMPCLAVDEITVEIHDASGTTPFLFDAGADFAITITSSTTRVNIFANDDDATFGISD